MTRRQRYQWATRGGNSHNNAEVRGLLAPLGTHLSKAGVTPRVAMAAMRHSSLDLTMNIYTDPVLLDVGAAVDALPTFSADRQAAPLATMPG
ncbi:MAG: hypothetical protein SVT52_05660 [Planctomycetota bacterium]|nr:hypothetical protein [Planctomycetota bacterium]